MTQSLDYFITSQHYAEQMGCKTSLDRILKMRDETFSRKRFVSADAKR